jgi:hypothetical protein
MAIEQIFLIPGLGAELQPGEGIIWETEQVVWEDDEVFWGAIYSQQTLLETDSVKGEQNDLQQILDSKIP